MNTNERNSVINIMVAVGLNNEIGGDNQLLWHLKDDLKLFKEFTSGHPVIMGRKTFESIGKALPNRKNLVITRGNISAENITIANSLEEAISLGSQAEGGDELYIIGGGQLYNMALDMANRLLLTVVSAEFPKADTFFPDVNFDQWKLIEKRSFPQNERNEFAFDFFVYERK